MTAKTMASAMLSSLLPRRISPSGSSMSRHLTSKRSHSALAVITRSNFTALKASNIHDVSAHNRLFSKFASVDHSAAYQEAMASSHGVQLKLALEEGRGKDDAPFDPFSQFLDEMGTTVEGFEGDDNDDEGADGGEKEIEEADYETIEEFDESESQIDDDNDDDEEYDSGPIYTTTGALHRPKSERLALRAGYPAGGKFAVIHLAGFQHKVTIDDLLVVNKLKPVSQWSVGSTHTIKNEDILLMANQDKTLVGLPGVKGGEVDVMAEEITRDKTLIVFKKRRRKNSRRRNGFRRQVTFLRVLDVRMPGEEKLAIERSNSGVNAMEEE